MSWLSSSDDTSPEPRESSDAPRHRITASSTGRLMPPVVWNYRRHQHLNRHDAPLGQPIGASITDAPYGTVFANGSPPHARRSQPCLVRHARGLAPRSTRHPVGTHADRDATTGPGSQRAVASAGSFASTGPGAAVGPDPGDRAAAGADADPDPSASTHAALLGPGGTCSAHRTFATDAARNPSADRLAPFPRPPRLRRARTHQVAAARRHSQAVARAEAGRVSGGAAR